MIACNQFAIFVLYHMVHNHSEGNLNDFRTDGWTIITSTLGGFLCINT